MTAEERPCWKVANPAATPLQLSAAVEDGGEVVAGPYRKFVCHLESDSRVFATPRHP